uniref:Limkain-b1 n=2 Tax=Lygus hesperus TaxID=30085 RepID=A0A0A9Z6Z8_LYGHE
MHNSSTQHKSKAVQSLLDKFRDAGTSGPKPSFKFPPPPPIHEPRLSPACNSDTSDSQAGSVQGAKKRGKTSSAARGCRERGESESERLPPIGVFWDIENCQIPHGKSALTVVQAIRNTFFEEYREAEFTVVCDVHKESPIIIQELNDAQVDLLHVISSSKNAADEKLRQAIRRFADLHGSPSSVVLISSDINFAPDLSDLRHRKKIHVILLHATNCSESLIMCANEHYNFGDFVLPLPNRNQQMESQSADIFVWNLPMTQGDQRIRWRLKTLSQNCGGRIIVISRPMAVLRFPTLEMALRAQKRMDGELVFGQAIRVGISHFMDPPVSFDNHYVNRSRGGYFSSFNGNNGSFRELNNSSFLPINPNPWICENGASAISDVQNVPSKPLEDSTVNRGVQSSTGNSHHSPWAWMSKDEDKNAISNGSQPILNGLERLSVSQQNNAVVGSSSGTTAKRNSYPANGTSNTMKGWNATPTFTTAFVDPRDWADNSKKRRTSPVRNSTQPSTRKSLESGWNPSKNSGSSRKCRTPSPYMFNSKVAHPLAVKPSNQNVANTSHPGDGCTKDNYFSPIPQSGGANGVELHITNLDQSIDPTEIKKILFKAFSEHVMVLHVAVFVQPDQSFAASVKVPTLQDAQLVISRLHRRKVGSKKLIISHAHPNQHHNIQYMRWQIISLLQDVPQHVLPLFKFLELFEARYVTPISVSDLFKLKDVCTITDESSGRMVALNSKLRDVQSPSLPTNQDIQPYCEKHFILQANGKGWAEQEAPPLPNVMAPLASFSANIKNLLTSHCYILPLSSLFNCYNAEFGPLVVNEHGVPLEHYVTCISQVELAVSDNGIKYLRPCITKSPPEEKVDGYPTSVSPSLASNLHLFEREVVDLLKTHPHCQLLFNKFIPAYHHHFGRQCRVADYGFTKLIDLLEALPHVLQVIGEGNKRLVTLSHRAQIRRFTADILRTLRSQPMKRMCLEELPVVFERILGRPFDPVDYGLCTLDDLVEHLSECAVLVNQEGVLSIPKKEQTTDEVKRTKQFAQEVVEIISQAPKCSIPFDRFIPAYHQHFTHQCRVSDFGFTKLIELFEAIPDTVKLDEDAEGRRITLTLEKKIMVLSEQMMDLVYPCHPPGLPLNNVESRYLWHYGYTLNPSTYNATSLEELMNQLSSVKVMMTEEGKTVVPLDGALLKQIASKVRGFLINADGGRMSLAKLRSHFSVYHEPHLTPQKLLSNMPDVVQLDEEDGTIIVELTPPYQFVRQLVSLISKNEGRMTLVALEEAYVKEYKRAPNPAAYGFANLEDFMNEAHNVFVLRGKGPRRQARLNKELTSSLRKPSNATLLSGSAICRPPSASDNSSISETSNVGDEPSWKQTSPMVVLPDMPQPPLNDAAYNLFSPYKGLLPPYLARTSAYSAPDPSELPLPKMVMVSEPEKEEGDSSQNGNCSDMFNAPNLFNGGASSNCSSTHSGNDSTTPGSANRRKKRLAAQFDLPFDLN